MEAICLSEIKQFSFVEDWLGRDSGPEMNGMGKRGEEFSTDMLTASYHSLRTYTTAISRKCAQIGTYNTHSLSHEEYLKTTLKG